MFSTLVILVIIHFVSRLEPSNVLAEISQLPSFLIYTNPFESTVATSSLLDDHSRDLLVALSGRMVALIWKYEFVSPTQMSGLMDIDSIKVGITDMIHTEDILGFPTEVEVIIHSPILFAVTSPLLSTVAILSSELFHLTDLSSNFQERWLIQVVVSLKPLISHL